MIKLAQYNERGDITTVVSVPKILRNNYPDLIEVPNDVGVRTHYVKDGICLPKGAPPSELHEFDTIQEVWVINTELAVSAARRDRDYRHKQSDWTQLPDVPLATKEAWAIYRQALRDITSQSGFPLNIEWPVEP